MNPLLKPLHSRLGFATCQIEAVTAGECGQPQTVRFPEWEGEWDRSEAWNGAIWDEPQVLEPIEQISITAIQRRTITTPTESGGNTIVNTVPVSAADLKAMVDKLGPLKRERFLSSSRVSLYQQTQRGGSLWYCRD